MHILMYGNNIKTKNVMGKVPIKSNLFLLLFFLLTFLMGVKNGH